MACLCVYGWGGNGRVGEYNKLAWALYAHWGSLSIVTEEGESEVMMHRRVCVERSPAWLAFRIPITNRRRPAKATAATIRSNQPIESSIDEAYSR